MDPRAHRLANTLVANDPGAATLEVTMVGPELEFEDARVAVVTGAQFEITLDGRPAPMNTPFAAASGSLLRFGARLRGARAYLGVTGGIAVEPIFGSRATHLPSEMGGLDGRALRNGDRLPLGQAGRPSFSRHPDADEIRDLFVLPDRQAHVRVLPGPHRDRFTDRAIELLQSSAFVIDSKSNRMGFRLSGPALSHDGPAEMLSDATPLGVLQVPAGGEPILLMADRQTTGGYPGIATIISADIGLAGQLAPGDSISFVVASLGEAMAALIAQERALMACGSGSGGRA